MSQDKPDLPTILRDLEIACYNFTKNPNKRTEEGIEEFKNSKHVIVASKYILEHSKKPEVHFHTLMGLTQAVLDRWSTLPPEAITEIRNYLLDYGARNMESAMQPYLKSQLFKSIATITKRGWASFPFPDAPETAKLRAECLSQLDTLISSPNIVAREMGITLCKEYVEEFCCASSPKNVPWLFHNQVKQSFQDTHLQTFFVQGLRLVQNILLLPEVEQNSENVKRLFHQCLNLLEAVLSWPFSREVLSSKEKERQVRDDDEIHVVELDPGVAWRPLLVQNLDVIQLYFNLYVKFRHDIELAILIKTGLLQLSSLHGPIFESDTQKINYVKHFIQGIYLFFSVPSPTPNDLLNFSQILHQLSRSFPVDFFGTGPTATKFFDDLASFTCAVLKQLPQLDGDDRTVSSDAMEELLSMWKQFFQTSTKPTSLSAYGATVFKAYVEARLKLASVELDDVDDAAPRDQDLCEDQLEVIAFLGRTEVVSSASVLYTMLAQRLQMLSEALQAQKQSQPQQQHQLPIKVIEETHWLIMISGYFLADNPIKNSYRELASPALNVPTPNNTIGVPPMIVGTSLQCAFPQDPIVNLCHLIFQVVDFENMILKSDQISLWSPTVAESLVWFLRRWANSYLRLNEHLRQQSLQAVPILSPNLVTAFIGNQLDNFSGIKKMLDFLVKKIVLNLMKIPHEHDVANETCELLFCVSALDLPRPIFMQLEPLLDLLRAHSANDKRLVALPAHVQRRLICGLTRLDLGEDIAAKRNYFTEVIKPVRENFFRALQQLSKPGEVSNPNIKSVIETELERLRGIAIACTAQTVGFFWGFFSEMLPALINVLKAYQPVSIIIAKSVMSLWLDFSTFMFPHVPPEAMEVFLENTMNFFTTFQDCGFAKRRKRRTTPEQDKEQASNLSKILKIVEKLVVHNHPRIPRTAFFGISVVLPAIAVEILQFPKLAALFYTVIGHLFKLHTDKLPLIPQPVFNAFMEVFSMTLSDHAFVQTYMVSEILDSITCMFNLYFGALQRDGTVVFKEPHKAAIVPVMSTLLEYLTYGDVFNESIVTKYPTALFALICYDPASFDQALGAVTKDASSDIKNQISQGVTILRQNVSVIFNDTNLKQFVTNFSPFATTFRRLIRKK